MRAREGRHLCRSLLVAGALAGGTTVPVLAQGPVPFATPDFRQVVQGLPQFLDEERVPELHRAWRSRAAQANASDDPLAAPSDTAKAGDIAMSTARAAMERRKALARQAPQVRERAEALSRLFGATAPAAQMAAQDGAAPAIVDRAAEPAMITTATTTPLRVDDNAGARPQPVAATAATSVATAPAETQKKTAKAFDDTLDPPYAVGGPLPDAQDLADAPSGAVPETAPDTSATGTLAPGSAAASASAAQMPPLPVRAPSTAPAKSNPVVTTARSAARTGPRRTKPDPATVFPNQLRAFGWNTQPE